MHYYSFRATGITSLPVELLARIFVLGAGFDFPYASSPFLLKPDQDYYAIPSSNLQLLVSQVCHHWRQIALSTSSLWNILHLSAPEHLPRAQEYLTRCTRSTQLLDIIVDTVAEPEYLQGGNLFRTELQEIFEIIIPHVRRWRSFHLKVRDHDCKALARRYLSTCGPAPSLQTLQLYHFEDYRTVQNLYLATYRPPVIVFNNDLPSLRNVSLIGVNLPWADSPYLVHLHNLELALHPANIRPPYEYWESMLRNSPDLQTLSLHYSGPRVANGDTTLGWPVAKERVYIHSLENLSLTDLDPGYLCLLMGRLFLPNLRRLSLDLPHQDFTSFVELIGGHKLWVSDEIPTTSASSAASSPSYSNTLSPSTSFTARSLTSTTAISAAPVTVSPFPIPAKIETLILTALECSMGSARAMLRSLEGLCFLEVHFSRVSDGLYGVLMEGAGESVPDGENYISAHSRSKMECLDPPTSSWCSHHACTTPLLPRLQTFKISGLSGAKVKRLIEYRESQRTPCCARGERSLNREYKVERWIVAWSFRRRGMDVVLDRLVELGWRNSSGQMVTVETFDDEGDEDEEEDDEGNEGDTSEEETDQ